MKIFAVMPVKNEASCYLHSALTHLLTVVDEVFIFDDRSTDESVELARELGATVVVREPTQTPFLVHEGMFRQHCWDAFVGAMQPKVGDWVLAIDADEYLTTADSSFEVGLELRDVVVDADHHISVFLPIPEIFSLEGGPQVRTDGFWGTIGERRLFTYQPGGRFKDRSMACGSQPTYVGSNTTLMPPHHKLALLHCGYADSGDLAAKFERYSRLPEGHSAPHVQSIPLPPTLISFNGAVPNVYRGVPDGK